MTILMISILSIGTKALSEVAGWFDWLASLKDPQLWNWTQMAFSLGPSVVMSLLLVRLGFADWLVAELAKFAEESERRARRERRRRRLKKEATQQEYEESKKCESAQDAAVKAEHYKKQIELQDRVWLWKYFSERHGSWSKADWHLHECMDFWERTAFDKRCWTKKDAAREMKKYQRELERRFSLSGLYENRDHICNLSREDIYQRIDFLEALDLEPEKKQSTIPGADARTAYSDYCDSEMEKELNAYRRKHRLDDQDESQYTPQQRERVQRIINRWEAQSDDGPPEYWSSGEENRYDREIAG